MKKTICILIACLLLTGCTFNHAPTNLSTTGTPPPSSTESTPEYTLPFGAVTFFIYVPNDDFDGFVANEMTIPDSDPNVILQLLLDFGTFYYKVEANSAEIIGSCLYLDLSESFYSQLTTMGSSGERMLIGSVVNTFISAYGVDTVMLTVNRQIIDSGHASLDSPFGFFE